MLQCTSSQTDSGSNPGAGKANQAVHSSGVGKLVAISRAAVALAVAEVKASDCAMAGVRLMQHVAPSTARWFPAVRTGVLRSSGCYIRCHGI
jgi:hypothetical protein